MPKSFYNRATERVAQDLLGKLLVRNYRGKRISGVITETEAYLGVTDPACHTFGGRNTARVRSMYLSGGHAYVYFTYGMHFCFNVVTRTEKHPEAVLIRSLEPREGIEFMRRQRGLLIEHRLTTGPAKLTQALGIDRKLDGAALWGSEIFIENLAPRPIQVLISPRVGIDYAGAAARWPLRFSIAGSKFLSRKPLKASNGRK